jgi:copper transport protein
MKFSVRWMLAIIGLIFAVLSVASILSGDDLLWGLDSFPHTSPPSGMGIVVGLAYISMLGSVGLMWFRAFVVKSVDHTAHRIAFTFSVITFLLHVLLVGFIRLWETGGSTPDLLSANAWEVASSASSVRAVIALAIGLPIQHLFARKDVRIERNRWGVVIGGLIALGSLTVVGHTAYQPPTWISHGMDFVHGVGASFWFGGLLGLLLFLRHAFRQKGDAAEAGRVVSEFSTYALLSVIALAVSGLVMATIIKDNPFERESAFAQALMVKLLLVLIPIAIAAYNRFRLLPRLRGGIGEENAWATLRRTTLIEATLVVVILMVTGFLVLASPIP